MTDGSPKVPKVTRWDRLFRTAATRTSLVHNGLVLPVLAPLVVTAIITILFSHRMWQKATSLQAQRIHQEMFLRIDAYLTNYFSVPVEALKLTQATFEGEQIESDSFTELEQHFWVQSQVFDQLNEIYWGSSQAESLGIVRRKNGSRELVSSGDQPGTRSLFRLNAEGDRGELIRQYNYDPRLRPWYQAATAARQAQWTDVYRWSSQPILGITLAQPAYDAQSQLQGVFAIDINLNTIQQFLQELPVADSRRIFIVDRSGLLIASSVAQTPFRVIGEAVDRLAPIDANDPVIREVSKQLDQEFGGIETIQQEKVLRYSIEGSAQLLRISPWRDDWGIDWLVVMSVPESEIVGNTRRNNRLIAILNGAALMLATILSLILGRWIVMQIRRRADRVQAQKDELHERTEELEQTLSKLQNTQDKLIEASTMSALGRLVSGVAHEVNTPLGNAILASSTLNNELQDLEAYLDYSSQTGGDRPVSDELLLDYLEAVGECSSIIFQNLQRAGQLVESFKLVAVEQSSLQQRSINLKDYINEVLDILAIQIGSIPHRIDVTGGDALIISTEPVAVYQVITHLLLNSVTHAYASGEAGTIHIKIEAQESRVLLRFSDDGKGIEPAIQRKIFMPFFTTASPAQNTGLGLHLVYNLVKQRLQGDISIESSPEKGASFLISFPLDLRQRPQRLGEA